MLEEPCAQQCFDFCNIEATLDWIRDDALGGVFIDYRCFDALVLGGRNPD